MPALSCGNVYAERLSPEHFSWCIAQLVVLGMYDQFLVAVHNTKHIYTSITLQYTRTNRILAIDGGGEYKH